MTVEEAQEEFARAEAYIARHSLLGFTRYTNRAYQPNWHHAVLAKLLDQVLIGEIKRLIVNMPPQHGKSELVSRRFPAYALGRYPNIPVIHCSYNADLATEMSRDVQQIIDADAYHVLFPHTRLATSKDAEVRMAAQFDVVGQEGSYRAAGVGQGITGKSMVLGIIDDPIKSREEAESETYRKKIWKWYTSDFRTRSMGDDARIVLVQTRWHEDDLAGRLLEHAKKNPLADQWRVVSFPAVLEELNPPLDPRQVNEALWPTRFSRAWLEATRVSSGIYDWSALYQQSPSPAGGGMAKRVWFVIVLLPLGGVLRRCRAWDLAGTEAVDGSEPAWTVGTRLAQCTNGMWCVEHVIRVRASANEVDQLMLQTARADGRQCLVREWQDPGAAGKAVIAGHRRLLAGFDYDGILASGEKSLQWRPFLVQAEGNNVRIVDGAWNTEWLDEMSMLPYSRFKDQADSVALAFNELAEVKALGPAVAAILPGSSTVSGPTRGAWREEFFRR